MVQDRSRIFEAEEATWMGEIRDVANLDWLFGEVLPLWWSRGADRHAGGFHDALTLTGEPVAVPKRLRVQARQVYVFAEAGRLGWNGPWREAMLHGAKFMSEHLRRPDGLFRALPVMPGTRDCPADLYDQAFAMLALSRLHVNDRSPAWEAQAVALFERLTAQYDECWSEFDGHVQSVRLNSLLHLFEALLAWTAIGEQSTFASAACRLRNIVMDQLAGSAFPALAEIQPYHQAFGELDQFWVPGHHYEWAYFLHVSEYLLGGDCSAAIWRLIATAEAHGSPGGRTVLACDFAGKVSDARCRLWSQTERLRAVLVLGNHFPEKGGRALRDSRAALAAFCGAAPKGLWRERSAPNGEWIDEPVPASSLYHLVGAIAAEQAAVIPNQGAVFC